MAYLLGTFLGGIIIVWLISMLAYWILKSETATIPVTTAWFVTSSLASFSMMDGGPWHWQAYFYYAPSAFAVWAYMRWKEGKAQPQDELENIFD